MDPLLLFKPFRDQIAVIKTAIFDDEREGPGRFRSTVIQIIGISEEGQLSFTIDKPLFGHNLEEEESFPCRLRFYAKAANHYLEVVGPARISTADLSYSELRKVDGEMVQEKFPATELLVHMQVDGADSIKLFKDRRNKLTMFRELMQQVGRYFLLRQEGGIRNSYMVPPLVSRRSVPKN